MFNSATPSLADIAAVTGNRNNDGFGDGNGWWVLIILFALFGGWGNGYGGYGNQGGAAATQADIQRGFDTNGIMSSLRGIEQGICNLGYDQLAQMNGINANISQTGYGINNTVIQAATGLNNSIQANTVANMQNTNAIQTQLAECCCENRAAIAQVRYDMATDACAIQNAIKDQTAAIIQNDNANYRQIHDELVSIQMNNKDEQIAQLTAKLNAADLAASQAAQNAYLINQLRPFPNPTYNVPNPFVGTGCCYSNCGCNSCCN